MNDLQLHLRWPASTRIACLCLSGMCLPHVSSTKNTCILTWNENHTFLLLQHCESTILLAVLSLQMACVQKRQPPESFPSFRCQEWECMCMDMPSVSPGNLADVLPREQCSSRRSHQARCAVVPSQDAYLSEGVCSVRVAVSSAALECLPGAAHQVLQ